jgi:hypothetical protein
MHRATRSSEWRCNVSGLLNPERPVTHVPDAKRRGVQSPPLTKNTL